MRFHFDLFGGGMNRGCNVHITDVMSAVMPEIVLFPLINWNPLNEFKRKLSLETWEDIFKENDINNMFNAFLNRFLKIYGITLSFVKTQ
jgi:hypothetical protein